MWYVLRVAGGREQQMFGDIHKVLEHFPGAGLFIPHCVRLRRYEGSWHTERAVLFPGYVFVDTAPARAEEIRKALYILNGSVTPVCIGGGFYPIREEEQRFLESIMDGMYEVGMSSGSIIDGELVVDRGPLVSMTQYVRRIDRHKRTAEVGVRMFGEERRVKMGLEVRTKS